MCVLLSPLDCTRQGKRDLGDLRYGTKVQWQGWGRARCSGGLRRLVEVEVRAGATYSPRPGWPAGSPALASRADQHLDLAVPLRARFGGVIALRSLRCEGARLHAVGGDAGAKQRVTNVADPLLAQGCVVLIGSAQEIRGSVDPEPDRRILTSCRSRCRRPCSSRQVGSRPCRSRSGCPSEGSSAQRWRRDPVSRACRAGPGSRSSRFGPGSRSCRADPGSRSSRSGPADPSFRSHPGDRSSRSGPHNRWRTGRVLQTSIRCLIR